MNGKRIGSWKEIEDGRLEEVAGGRFGVDPNELQVSSRDWGSLGDIALNPDDGELQGPERPLIR